MFVRIAQKGKPWSDCPVCLDLFGMQLVFKILEHLPHTIAGKSIGSV